MYLTKKELESINAAIDFIAHHADGADDYTPFEEMQTNLRNAWNKGMKEYHNKKRKKK